ncbi:hypothetical protein [Sphingomonas sp. CARO-RG-8B-R24-01]|uniref:hypothetical protein n=1 Tax=Sphingomonas sp. CARO-RG-8B-R24-01 TaxID=2914831 RepID=UPI001F57A2A6
MRWKPSSSSEQQPSDILPLGKGHWGSDRIAPILGRLRRYVGITVVNRDTRMASKVGRVYSSPMLIDRRNLLRWSGVSASALVFGACARAGLGDAAWPGPDVPAGQVPKLPIGMNLAGVSDYGAGFPFRNLMWGARMWMTHNADGSGPWDTQKQDLFSFDADGYPRAVPVKQGGSLPDQAVFTLLPNTLKSGKYVLLYDGDGTFAGVASTRVISQSRGRVVLHMSHDGKLVEGFFINRSNPADPVRNIRVVALADEHIDLAADPFLPEFLEFCRPFHVLRFMDWGITNGSIEEEWSNRRRPTFYTMTGTSGDPDDTQGHAPNGFARHFAGGVAYEIMIQLANTLGIDPWICIPHRATDDYVAQLAKLIHTKLDPKRKVYVEVSNEIWNFQFYQTGWMLHSRRLGDMVEAKGEKAWDDDAKTKGTNHPARIGALFGHVFQVWQRAWPAADRARYVRVCATQTAWLDVALRTIDSCMAHGGCDAVAQSGYFGAGDEQYARWEARGAALTAEEVINDMRIVIRKQAEPGAALTAAQHAKKLGLRYVVYEGGQHLQPKGQADLPYNPALGAAQSQPGMYDLYLDTLRLEVHLGCDLFCAFNSIGGQGSRYGSWGVVSSYDQPSATAPKYRALLAANTVRA